MGKSKVEGRGPVKKAGPSTGQESRASWEVGRFVNPCGMSGVCWPYICLPCVFCAGQIMGNEAVRIVAACGRNASPDCPDSFDFFSNDIHKLSLRTAFSFMAQLTSVLLGLQ